MINSPPSHRFDRASAGHPLQTALLALALFSPLATAAQTDAADLTGLALEDLLRVDVLSASRFLQSITDAPATVTVIGEDELRRREYRNLAEALVTVPGVYASNDRGYTSLGVRGFNRSGDYGSRILLLSDGARRNDPIYDQALFGNEAPIEMDWVKRLEFVAGPASAVYGPNALFGTVNAVMLSGGDIGGSRVRLDTGTNNSKRLSLVAGQKLDANADWFLGFAAYKSAGGDLYFPEFDAGASNGRAQGLNGEDYRKAYAKLHFGNWRLTGNYSTRNKDIPTAWYGTNFGERGTWTRDESGLVDLRYEGDDNTTWQPSFRVFAGRYRFDAGYRLAPAQDTGDFAAANWLGSELHLAYTDIAQHRISFGVDAQWNTRVEQRYFELGPRQDILNTNNPSALISLFVQDEWRFLPDWLLNIGLRHDKNRDFAAVTSPRFGLIWQPTQRLSLKAMMGSAYRVPNAYERFYNDGNIAQSANPDVQPETMSSSELAAIYRFGQGGRLGISVYKNRMRKLIDPTADASGVSSYANQGRAHAQGIEIDAESQWSGGYRLRGSIAWQQSKLESGARPVNSPELMGKLVFGLPVAFGWTASGELLGLSSRRSDTGTAPGYGIVNLSLSSAPAARFGQFSASIYNLGNRRYFDPGSSALIPSAIQQDGRQLRLSWTLAL